MSSWKPCGFYLWQLTSGFRVLALLKFHRYAAFSKAQHLAKPAHSLPEWCSALISALPSCNVTLAYAILAVAGQLGALAVRAS